MFQLLSATEELYHAKYTDRLDENYVVKVGDFGLARDVYSHLYYRGNKHSRIPVKWAAPEMLNDGICTEKSDVVCIASHILLLMVEYLPVYRYLILCLE